MSLPDYAANNIEFLTSYYPFKRTILMCPCCRKCCHAYWVQCGAPPSAYGSCQPCIPRKRWGELEGWHHLWATHAPCPCASCYACVGRSQCVHGGVHGICDETGKIHNPHKKAHWDLTMMYSIYIFNPLRFRSSGNTNRIKRHQNRIISQPCCFVSSSCVYSSCTGF